MKTMICMFLFGVSTTAFSQISYPVADDQIRSEMSANRSNSDDVNGHSKFGITAGYAGFNIDNVARQGFAIDLHAFVSKISAIQIELNGGVVLYNTPSSSERSSLYSPYMYQSTLYGQDQFSQPRFNLNFALAYAGSDAVYYFSDGKVRPYVAAGVQAVTWQMNQGFAGTIAPSTRAGIEIAAGSSFRGFAEARYMYGMPNILNQYISSLKYVTTVAFGVSFAPHL